MNEQQDAVRKLAEALDNASAAAQAPALPETLRFKPVECPMNGFSPTDYSVWRKRAAEFLGERVELSMVTW